MSLGESIPRRFLRFRPSRLTPLAGVFCMGVACALVASANQDERDQMEAQIERVDEMSDGRLKEYFAKVSEYTTALGDFVQFLEENPEGASEYRQLIFSAVRRGDWSAVMIIGSAPPRVLLDTWVSEVRPGGEFREMFLERMASRDLGPPSHIWEVFEKGRYPYPDFRLHEDYMRMHPVEEAAPLIEYMLRSHPLMAMDILLDIYPDQLPDAEAVFDDHWTIKKIDWKYDHSMLRGDAPWETRDAFNRLSRHDVWWVRLYAVSAMNKRGPFRLEHRLKALHDDPSEPVSRAAKAISPPENQRDGARNRG